MLLPELKDGARLHHVGCYLPREPEHTCGELSQEGLACGCSRGTQGCRQRDLPGSLWNGGGGPSQGDDTIYRPNQDAS